MGGPVYVADCADRLRQVELDGLTALFHLPSGMTHILAPPAPQILEVLAGRPGDSGEILARLSERYEIAGVAAGLQSRLDELVAAGLVQVSSEAREARRSPAARYPRSRAA